MWLFATAIPGTAQLTCWFSSCWRLIESAMAVRRSGDSRASRELAMSSCSNWFEVSTSLCAPGNPVTSVRNDGVTVAGSATCTNPRLIHDASSPAEVARCTVTDLALARAPHHFGFCTSLMDEFDTEAISNGPPDRSMPGLTVGQFGFQPTFSITCAGRRFAKSFCQSANTVLNLTVTVWP